MQKESDSSLTGSCRIFPRERPFLRWRLREVGWVVLWWWGSVWVCEGAHEMCTVFSIARR